MSQRHGPVGLAIEWGPQSVLVGEGAGREVRLDRTGSGLSAYAGRTAVLVVSRRTSFVRTIRVPNASRDEIALVLMMRMADLFPIPVSDLAYDFILTDDVSSEGRLAVVYAVPCAELRLAIQTLRTANIKISRVIPAAIGSSLMAASVGSPNATVVDLDGESTAVDLVVNGLTLASRLASAATSLEVEIARTRQVFGIGESPVVSAGEIRVPGAARSNAGGLATIALASPDSFRVNLALPETKAADAKARADRRRNQAIMILVAAILLAYYAVDQQSEAATVVQNLNSKLNNKLKQVKAGQAAAESDYSKTSALDDAVRLAFRPAQRPTDVLSLATNLVPANVWLTGLTFERGKPLLIRGTSKNTDSVSKYLMAINANPRFRDGKLVFANNSVIDKTPVVQFSISTFPVGNLPIVSTGARKPASPARKVTP